MAKKPAPPADTSPDEDMFPDEPAADAPAPAAKPARKPRSGSRTTTERKTVTASNAAPAKPTADPVPAAAGRVVVNLDKRELTKKQQQQINEKWRGSNYRAAVDSYFAEQLAVGRQKFGDETVIAARPQDQLLVGIPLPSIAMEYVIAQDVFPLGLVYHLNGMAGSLKSSLLYDIYRWFYLAGGGGHLHEVEDKWSQEHLQGIVRYPDDRSCVILDKCNSVEEWQQRLMYWLNSDKKKMTGTKEAPGPGRIIPICYGVDSIMGKLSFETQEKVIEAGAGVRGHPVEALKITNWLKTVPQLITGWPFAIVLVNHLKWGTDDKGHDERHVGGGQGVGFQESFELETEVSKSQISCVTMTGKQIRIRNRKNSFGEDFRQIETRLLWWDEPDQTGRMRHTCVWDWHWATIKLLSTLTGGPKARLSDAGFHLATPKASDWEHTAWSKNLGMKETDALPWDQVGKMLHDRQDLKALIRRALGIRERPLLQGDYLQQLNELKAELP